MKGKRKKLNLKNEYVQERVKENPKAEKKEFNDLLDKMMQPSERNGVTKQ